MDNDDKNEKMDTWEEQEEKTVENGGKKNHKLVEGKWKADKNPPHTNKRSFSIPYCMATRKNQ